MTAIEAREALAAFERQRFQAIEDLQRCVAHNIPVNRCEQCWPVYLKRLGDLCVRYYAESKNLQINVLSGGMR